MKKKTPTPITATKEQAESTRKPKSETSDKWIQLRVTEAEKKDIQSAAKLTNRSVSDYLLACHAAIAAKLRE
jgi:uncharacterized protein (DUF1778 family)